MLRLALKKLAILVPVALAVSVLTFLLMNLLPGDPAYTILGSRATPQSVAELTARLHLDEPVWTRYSSWLGGVLTGDLGQSYLNYQPASSLIGHALPVTLELLVLSQVIALALAVPLGVYSARHPRGWVDRIASTVSFGTLAMPPYMLGVLLVSVFSVGLKALPATGFTPFGDDPGLNLRSMVLPSLTLALGSLAVYVRLLRTEMISTLQQDFVTVARAKGLPGRAVLWRHTVRPSMFSLVTAVGINLGSLIGGAFVVEYIFALPGVGALTLNSIFQRDYLVVQACVLVVAVGYVLVNLLVDLLYPIIDPRVRHV
ncbi:ABC transporter permease [Actinomadura atramentaria]|uniref:ABC transporter permease n=1 Tax=Actinomadura atramentaria TaxID=1990 RepID=UPI0003669F6D|nr:ABC transporter permease [Actinomadura atramentaria]